MDARWRIKKTKTKDPGTGSSMSNSKDAWKILYFLFNSIYWWRKIAKSNVQFLVLILLDVSAAFNQLINRSPSWGKCVTWPLEYFTLFVLVLPLATLFQSLLLIPSHFPDVFTSLLLNVGVPRTVLGSLICLLQFSIII